MNSTETTALPATTIRHVGFFGTPHFAVPTLDALRAAGRTPRVVVSQPTRGVGRGRRPKPPPVAAWALEHDVELIQTANVRDPEVIERLGRLELDLAIVVAFGQIFRRALLDLPRLGCMNLHASLLPAYRGASPIVAAIREGESVTGASTMLMERGLDSGPVLLQDQLEIGPAETAGELAPRLAELGARLVVHTLEVWEAGGLSATPQEHSQATLAPLLDRDEGWIDWQQPAQRIHDLVRAFDPWPGTRSLLGEQALAIKKVRLVDAARPAGREPEAASSSAAQPEPLPGTVLGVGVEGFRVATGERGSVEVLRVQRPNRRPVSGRDFANGEGDLVGRRFAASAVG